MAKPKNTSKPQASSVGTAKRAPATLRSMSGAGFEFEDLISAWQLVKGLSGEQVPGVGGVITQVQAITAALKRSIAAFASTRGKTASISPMASIPLTK